MRFTKTIIFSIVISFALSASVFTIKEKKDNFKTIKITFISDTLADPPAPAPSVIPVNEGSITEPAKTEYESALSGLMNVKNLTPAGIAVLIVQILLLIFRSPLGRVTGVARLLIVQGLTIVLGYLCFWFAGASFWVAISDSTMLGFVQIFIHQFYKQVIKHESDLTTLNRLS